MPCWLTQWLQPLRSAQRHDWQCPPRDPQTPAARGSGFNVDLIVAHTKVFSNKRPHLGDMWPKQVLGDHGQINVTH